MKGIDEHTAEQARLTDEIKSLSDAIGEIKRHLLFYCADPTFYLVPSFFSLLSSLL
jgi:hypothetical protein